MAAVRSVTASCRAEVSTSAVDGSTSTKTGVPPAAMIASAVAMNVFAGTSTCAPGSRPPARSASSIASVPFATPITEPTPSQSAKRSSNDATAGPSTKPPDRITSRTAASSFPWMGARGVDRSTKGIIGRRAAPRTPPGRRPPRCSGPGYGTEPR